MLSQPCKYIKNCRDSASESRQRTKLIRSGMLWKSLISSLLSNALAPSKRPERQWPLLLARQRPQTFLFGLGGIRQAVSARNEILAKDRVWTHSLKHYYALQSCGAFLIFICDANVTTLGLHFENWYQYVS